MQLMASNGYGVIYCNPRGSVGYGGEFADLRGKYYTVDYDGIMEFLDEALLCCDWIDENRLAVTGCSYGGMMTNWAITHTDRFKAAVSDCCCVNEIADYFLSDIGFSFGEDVHGATLWDEGAASRMWETSPIKYAPNVTTPTLFIHGADDFRCSAEQSLQMFAALKYHGVDTRAVIFKEEKHALAFEGKPAGRVRRFEEILAWFDKYLRGREHA
jgi:dipeptidyl aminopeptidase/acylaminoacyl peptidase